MTENSCLFSDLPAHASILTLKTGTCVDYSVALTTLLRMVGYSKDEVYSVGAPGHEYNLVKFPEHLRWRIVDTVGNSPYPFRNIHWTYRNRSISHCDYYAEECMNDNGVVSCPSKFEVEGCIIEGIL